MNKIKVGIIGGAGYTGGELLRILLQHAKVDISFVHSRSNAGKPVYTVHLDLIGETELHFTSEIYQEIQLLFLCLGHGESTKFLAENVFPSSVKIIDLTHDYRLQEQGQRKQYQGLPFIYGLPELNKQAIREATYVANPGCFATAIQLGLLPLAKAGLLTEIYTTGITGSTGAGQSLSATSHFSWRVNNIQAYKTLQHQHIAEINQSLQQLQESYQGTSGNQEESLHFVPWRGDFARGIFISSQLTCMPPIAELQELFFSYYASHPFVHVSAEPISLKQVVNTNKAVIQLEKKGRQLVIHSAIDNLLKGACGQAVQNMNLMCGFDEREGLQLKAVAF